MMAQKSICDISAIANNGNQGTIWIMAEIINDHEPYCNDAGRTKTLCCNYQIKCEILS